MKLKQPPKPPAVDGIKIFDTDHQITKHEVKEHQFLATKTRLFGSPLYFNPLYFFDIYKSVLIYVNYSSFPNLI